MRTRSRRLVAAIAVAAIALASAEIVLDTLARTFTLSNTGWALMIVTAFAAVGLLLAWRVPANPIGWLLLAFALPVEIGNCCGDYALLAYRLGHHGLPLPGLAATIATITDVMPIYVLPLPIALFPDGRLGGAWRRVLRAYLLIGCVFFIGMLAACAIGLAHGRVGVDGSGALAAVKSPGGPTSWWRFFQVVVLVPVVPIWLAMIARQAVRYRHTRGLERAQMKWLLAGAIGSMGAIAYFVAGLGNGNSAFANAAAAIAGAFFAALPACIGVAILRYRLYDLDRLISRTLSYALLTAMLAGAFISVVALTTDVLPFSSRVGVAASTLVSAALFNPLRHRIQRAVDRRFNRARYDAQATVAAFTARLRDAVELEAVRGELLATVHDAVQPSHVSVWLR